MPRCLGRFNFITVKQDVFEVLFKPMIGDVMITIAKDMTREEAVTLMSELNSVIDDFRTMSFADFKSDIPDGSER
jgi:hypothetical protein